jgi:hypothetical protein
MFQQSWLYWHTFVFAFFPLSKLFLIETLYRFFKPRILNPLSSPPALPSHRMMHYSHVLCAFKIDSLGVLEVKRRGKTRAAEATDERSLVYDAGRTG